MNCVLARNSKSQCAAYLYGRKESEMCVPFFRLQRLIAICRLQRAAKAPGRVVTQLCGELGQRGSSAQFVKTVHFEEGAGVFRLLPIWIFKAGVECFIMDFSVWLCSPACFNWGGRGSWCKKKKTQLMEYSTFKMFSVSACGLMQLNTYVEYITQQWTLLLRQT